MSLAVRQEEVVQAALLPLVLAAMRWKQLPTEIPTDHLDRAGQARPWERLRPFEALLRIGFASILLMKSRGQWLEKAFGVLPRDEQPPPLSPRIPRREIAKPRSSYRPPGDPCPPYTAVSVLPAKFAVADNKQGSSSPVSS